MMIVLTANFSQSGFYFYLYFQCAELREKINLELPGRLWHPLGGIPGLFQFSDRDARGGLKMEEELV